MISTPNTLPLGKWTLLHPWVVKGAALDCGVKLAGIYCGGDQKNYRWNNDEKGPTI